MPKKPLIVRDHIPTIALVGRVNVGKSTLFNRMIEQRHALVSEKPGTTRTRNVGMAWWRGEPLRFIDTGGLTFDEHVPFEKEIMRQTELATREADLIALVVDIRTTLLPQERALVKRLRTAKKPIVLIGNKADTTKIADMANEREWLGLGLGAPIPVSAQNGRAVGDLLDFMYEKIKQQPEGGAEAKKHETAIRVAIVGKPNVGKSSLFNALLGEERVIVSPIAHTTREPHDVLLEWEGTPLLFIDTAGIRRQAQMKPGLEKEGVEKSLRALKDADIAILVLDASDDLSAQDQRLAELIEEQTVGMVIVLNKWDLVEDNQNPEVRAAATRQLQRHFPFASYAPITFVSALNSKGMYTMLPLIKKVYAARHRMLTPEELQPFFETVIRAHRPLRGRGTRFPKLLGFKQIDTNPPVFQLVIQTKTSLHIAYTRYLKNRLREHFDFSGTPIIIKMTKRNV